MMPTIMLLLAMGQVQTDNFKVKADTPEFTAKVARYAEDYRRSIAREWFGEEVPRWNTPHQIFASTGQPRSGRNESFLFFAFTITVTGDESDILHSSLPHEVCHSVMQTRLHASLPLWADEGMAMLCEHEEKTTHPQNTQMAKVAAREPFGTFLVRKDLPLFFETSFYGQAYSLTNFLVGKKGKREFVKFIDAIRLGDWCGPLKEYYGYEDLNTFQVDWETWHIRTFGSFAE